MKILAMQQLLLVGAGFTDECMFEKENWQEHYNQANGYVMGAVGAFLTTAIAQTMHEVFFSIGAGFIGGAVGYLIGYSLSSYTQH